MKFKISVLAACLFLAAQPSASAQHAGDIEFEYAGGGIVFIGGEPGFADGRSVFEAEFAFGGPFDRFTDEPGFISEIDQGLGINPSDVIDYNVLQSRFGRFLNYWNPATGQVESTSVTLEVSNQPSGTHLITEFGGGGGSAGFIGQADGAGDFHHHVDFLLSAGAPIGAYAVLFELTTTANGIANSDAFYVVWNYGMDEAQHGQAVEFFQAIPEPAALPLLGMLALAGLRSRRRRA